MLVADQILKLLDRRSSTRGKDPEAFEQAGNELRRLKATEPTAWATAMRWIGATIATVVLMVGSGCAAPIALTPSASPSDPPGTVRPVAGVRIQWTADGIAIVPYVRMDAFPLPPGVGTPVGPNVGPRGAHSLGGPVSVPPLPTRCPGR